MLRLLTIMLGCVVGSAAGAYQRTDVLLSVINFSPFTTVVDFRGPENCMTHGGPGAFQYVEHYFQSFRSDNLSLDYGKKFAELDPYLKGYKYVLNISDIGKLIAGKADVITLPSHQDNSEPAFVTYATTTNADSIGPPNVCGNQDSWMEFSINVSNNESVYRLSDNGDQDDHFILQALSTPDGFGHRAVRESIPLGRTFEVSWQILVSEVVVAIVAAVIISATAGAGLAIAEAPFGLATEMWELSAETESLLTAWPEVNIAGGIMGLITAAGIATEGIIWGLKGPPNINMTASRNITRDIHYFGIGDAYANITEDKRSACILTHVEFWQPYCGVAGISMIIQPNGGILVLPLPAVSTAWK